MAESKSPQIKVEQQIFDLAHTVARVRRAKNLSDYVRGLVLLDAMELAPNLICAYGLPGWITLDRRFRTASPPSMQAQRKR